MVTNFPNGVSSFGGVMMPGLGVPPGGRVFWLDPTRGSDSFNGDSPERAFATLPTAYAALRDGYNDVLYQLPGGSTSALTAEFVWSKSYAHWIGLAAPTHVAQRCRITQATGTTDISPLITFSGSGNIISNVYAFAGIADAGSLINVSVTGQRNYFQNFHFAGGGHATSAINGGAALSLGGAENTYERCTVGVDTADQGAGWVCLLLPATPATTRDRFIDCDFRMHAGNNGAMFVELMANGGLDREMLFKDCRFINLGTSLLGAFGIPADIDTANKRFLLQNCTGVGFAAWDANSRSTVLGNMNEITSDAIGGVAKVLQG